MLRLFVGCYVCCLRLRLLSEATFAVGGYVCCRRLRLLSEATSSERRPTQCLLYLAGGNLKYYCFCFKVAFGHLYLNPTSCWALVFNIPLSYCLAMPCDPELAIAKAIANQDHDSHSSDFTVAILICHI